MCSINIFMQLSTFLLINLCNINNFSSEIFLGMLGIKPRTAVSGSKYANYCATLPSNDARLRESKPWTDQKQFAATKKSVLLNNWSFKTFSAGNSFRLKPRKNTIGRKKPQLFPANFSHLLGTFCN